MFGGTGFAGRELAEPDHLRAARGAAFRVPELIQQHTQGALDLGGAGGELGQQHVVHTVDLEPRRAPRTAVPQAPGGAGLACDGVGDQAVVHLADRNRRRIEGFRVDAAPHPVQALDFVRDHQVGVQVRVTGAGVPVVERGRDRSPNRDLRDTLTPDASEQRVRLDQLKALRYGVAVRGGDAGLRGRISQCPQHADRLRHRERQVEPGHRDRGPPAVLLGLDAGDRGDPFGLRQVGRQRDDAGRDAFGGGLVQRPVLAQRGLRDRVQTQAEQPLHPDLIDQPIDPGTAIETGQTGTEPAARRVAVGGVVGRQRHCAARSTSPQQVCRNK